MDTETKAKMVRWRVYNHALMSSEESQRDYMAPEKEWLRKLANGSVIGLEKETSSPKTEIRREIKQPASKRGHGFDDVAGMEELKRLVTEGLINVLNNPECAKAYGITPPSLLLFGPAGCGKTFFAEKLAEEAGVNFIKIVPDDLASTLIHGTQEKIGELFRRAAQKAPTIIFFDEFDAMVPRRSIDDQNYQNGETNEFLCMLNNAAEKGIYVLAATNHPERIDKAVLRSGRIDEMVYVDMPDFEARESLFRLKLSKLPVADDVDFARLAELSQGYNCSDINYIVEVASRKMFNVSIMEKDKPYKAISQVLLEDSISNQRPSVSSRDLRELERVRNEFLLKGKDCNCTTIGFHI